MTSLPVPYIPQWGTGANLRRTDCGIASVAMLLSFYGLLSNLTIDQLDRETPLASSDNGLTCAALVDLAAKHDLKCEVHKNTTIVDICAELHYGRPVIALIAYRDISERMDKADNQPGRDLHFVVITGYDDNGHFTINDPDWWTPLADGGHDLVVATAEIDKALSDAMYSRQCVFIKEEVMTDTVFLQKISGELKALAAEVDAQIVAATSVPAPVPTPPPASAKVMVVNTDTANVRDMPTTNGKIVGTLPRGTEVTVADANVSADGHSWSKITVGQFVNGYVATDLLVPKA